jgi:hypothetical protein
LSFFCRALVDERDLLEELPLLDDFERLLDALERLLDDDFDRLDELRPLPVDFDPLDELRLRLDLDLDLGLGLEPWLAICSPPET